MSEDVLVSVRGEARRMVAPDYASLHGRLTGFAGSSGEALALVRAAQDGVTTALGRLGGTALTVDTHQAPLTWSVGSIGTHDEHDFAADRTSGRAVGGSSRRSSARTRRAAGDTRPVGPCRDGCTASTRRCRRRPSTAT